MPAPLRFIQLSDLHLGAPLAWLPVERRAERRREQQAALEAAVRLATEHAVDAILLPGDLFDLEGVDVETLAFAVHAFARPGCPPVFIAPGNHDPSTTASLSWNARLLGARGWAWPEHVHVFRDAAWTAVALADRPLTVWGRSFASSARSFERPLAADTLPHAAAFESGRVHVAVFHGSREGVCPPAQAVTAPFSVEEALAAPFAYSAVGHYHRPSRIDDDRGTRLAYAGSAVALDVTETGAHGALLVTIDDGAARIEPLELDARRAHALDVDASGASSAADIDRRILAAFEAAGVGERDIARVSVVGRIVRGVRYEAPGAELVARVFALRVDVDGLRPDYDLDTIRAREPSTTEDRFVHALLAELDAETDPERRARVLSAIYYGLDAFRLRDVAPAYEELAEAREEIGA
jgi:DNA repair exonuclease SbcCD nuclease subunit